MQWASRVTARDGQHEQSSSHNDLRDMSSYRVTSGQNALNDLCGGFGLDLTKCLSARDLGLGKVDLVSRST